MSDDGLLGEIFSLFNLKRIPRLGWIQRGIPWEESVAAHSFGTALLALLFKEEIQRAGLNFCKVLELCLVHDLHEATVGDVPRVAVNEEKKRELEKSAARSNLPPGVLTLWEEFVEGTTVEAKLARELDRLETTVQAALYVREGFRGAREMLKRAEKPSFQFLSPLFAETKEFGGEGG